MVSFPHKNGGLEGFLFWFALVFGFSFPKIFLMQKKQTQGPVCRNTSSWVSSPDVWDFFTTHVSLAHAARF